MAAYVPANPTAVSNSGGVNYTFVSTLQNLDRAFIPKLVEKFGADMYTMALSLFGKKTVTENREFYHYENRKRLSPVQVASKTGGASPNVTCVVTIKAANHIDTGKQSSLRVGEVYMDATTGISAKIESVNKTVDGAHTATFAPLRVGDTFGPAADAWLLPLGPLHGGEATTAVAPIQPLVDKVINQITEVREDFKATDKASMERIEWIDPFSGKHSYRNYCTGEAEKRFLLYQELLTMFSELVTGTNVTGGSKGTKGAVRQILDGGSDLGYTSGSMAVVDWQAVTRNLTFNGAATELHVLSDIYQYQEFQRLLFGTFDQGAILWDSVGGSAEAAAKMQFKSFQIDGYTAHFKKYAPFSPEWVWGVSPVSANYRHFGLVIPQGFASQPDGSKLPTIGLRYQEIPGIGEINAYEHGGLAQVNKTPEQAFYNTIVGHYGVQVAAANQTSVFQG